MQRSISGIVFSKDRAFQLDGTLRTFFLHCKDAQNIQLNVLYRCSTEMHSRQYAKLKTAYPSVRFIEEQNFREQVLSELVTNYVLFLVDDNIFVRDFFLADVLEAMEMAPQALGFSLRLGRNTTYCYAMNHQQAIPALQPLLQKSSPHVLRYAWVGTEWDFAYPLEVSSSVYRSAEIGPLLHALSFNHPNSLEAAMSQHSQLFGQKRPELLCYETSITFCNPINKVQNVAPTNRAGESVSHSADDLSSVFDAGGRLDTVAYTGFIPNACHQEVPLRVSYDGQTSIIAMDSELDPVRVELGSALPLVSVIIPAYKQAQFLPEAIGSVLTQTYPHWECVVVNDGSPDETSAVVRSIISSNRGSAIRLIEKDNEGLAEARNTGIQEARGAWILPLDSDDKFEPTMLEKAVSAALTDSRVNIVSTWVKTFGAREEIIPIRPFSQQELMVDNIFPYASLYQRSLWEEFGGYDPLIPFGAEDYNFWIKCSGVLNPRTVIEPLFLYRKHQGASMVDAVMSHRSEVNACIHTCHPKLYSASHLLQAHDILAAMHEDTRAALDRLIIRFPQYSQLYLWRGLHHEAKGLWRQAMRDFEAAAKLASDDDWQPSFRIAVLSAERKDLRRASLAAKVTLERCPAMPARTQLEYLVSAV